MGQNRWDAVVFDYGRVLSQSPTLSELQEFAALVGVNEPPFFELYSNTRDDYDCGRIDCQQHWQCFANAAGISLTADQVQRIVEFENRLWLRANPRTLELAHDIRSYGVRTAILSNMPPDLLCELRQVFDWLSGFEVQIWSCEHGIIKPDPAIYHLCLQRLNCEPRRVLFFDDRPRNVEAALTLGMGAHVFESAEHAAAIVRAGLNGSHKA
ncbi:MAG: HAD family phosphatase [Candidatus Korobacteraceae bacterium]